MKSELDSTMELILTAIKARLGDESRIIIEPDPTEAILRLAEAFQLLAVSKCAMEDVKLHAESHGHGGDDDFPDFEGLN